MKLRITPTLARLVRPPALLLLALITGFTGAALPRVAPCAAAVPPADPPYAPRPAHTLNYSMHVAPILYTNCVVCHRPGEVAPFSLLTYADAKRHARQIAKVVGDRQMPPWKAVHGWGEFVDERRLTNLQIGMIRQWADEGAAEGDAKYKPLPPRFKEGWPLGKPDLVLRAPKPYTLPAGGPDRSPCFVLPIKLPADKWVRAIDFRPGCPGVVHHALFLYDRSGAARRRQEEAEKTSPDPGYDSNAGMGFFPTGGLGGWGPGTTPRPFPADTAGQLPRDVDLVIQIHYHPDGQVEHDQSQLAVYFADRPPRRILCGFILGTFHLDIPAGEKNYKAYDAFTLPVDAELTDIAAHMHLIGKECRAVAELPGGQTVPLTADGSAAPRRPAPAGLTTGTKPPPLKTPLTAPFDPNNPFGDLFDDPPAGAVKLMWVRDWDINWQGAYRYVRPLRLPKGTRIKAEWAFDNSEDNPHNPYHPSRRITFGGQSTEEMAGLLVGAIVDRPEDALGLGLAVAGHTAEVLLQPDVRQRAGAK